MSFSKTLSLAVLLACTALARPAAGGITVTSSSSPPDDQLLLGIDGEDLGGFDWQHGSAPEIAVGQTFHLAERAVLEKITVKILPQTDIGNETISLWLAAFSGPSDYSIDSVARVYVGWLPSDLVVGSTAYVTFHLPGYALEADREYGFLLRFEGGGGVNNNRAQMMHAGGDLLATGLAYCYTTSEYVPFDEDLIFFLQGRTERPLADDCDTPRRLRDNLFEYGLTDFNILTTTVEVNEPRESCVPQEIGTSNSVWFKTEPIYCGTLEISTAGSTYDTVVSVYDGSCEDAHEIACDDNGGNAVDAYLTDVPFVADQRVLIKVADHAAAPQPEGGDLTILIRGRPAAFDYDLDCTLSLGDLDVLCDCMEGPGINLPVDVLDGCWLGDGDGDQDIDLRDIGEFQSRFGVQIGE